MTNKPKTASQVQAEMLAALSEDARAERIVVDQTISFSDDPLDPETQKAAKQPTVVIEAVMSRESFFAFRKDANARGVWVRAVWKPLGVTGKFVYTLIGTPIRLTIAFMLTLAGLAYLAGRL